jgi:hypothetical protein
MGYESAHPRESDFEASERLEAHLDIAAGAGSAVPNPTREGVWGTAPEERQEFEAGAAEPIQPYTQYPGRIPGSDTIIDGHIASLD